MDNKIVFAFFDKLAANDRDETLYKAIYIGVLALMEDRLATFLSKTQNELGTELESLKLLFDMKKELFYKSSVKGLVAEDDVTEALNQYFIDKKLKDIAHQTGNTAGKIKRNKTGDIVCKVDGVDNLKIVVECKFDKSIRLGDIESREIFSSKTDTAWSQLLEAKVNRESKVSIIVFDAAFVDNSVLNYVESVSFIHGIGFIAIVDSQKGDYSNLFIAYRLARDIVLNASDFNYDPKILTLLVKRIIKDINSHFTIQSLVHKNIETNKEILRQLQKTMLLMEFNEKYLRKFLSEGTLTAQDLLDFYESDEVRENYKSVEANIKNMLTEN
ncbi:MAG TPA: hypothetical protein VGJ90_04105 [Methylophilaceae bacterium]